MFIKRLSLTDWKSHKITVLEFGKVNLIRGANNVGKSSVSAALEFLLTGRCESTGEAGQGGTDLIRVGAKKASLRAEIGGAHGLTIERERSHGGSNVLAAFNGRQYAGRQFDELMEKRGYAKDVVSAAMRGGRFLSLSQAEQKELLATVLKPEAADVPKEIREAIEVCFAGFEIEQIDLEGARELEERATKLRAECTAALRELGEPEKVEERPEGSPTSAQVEKKLGGLRSEMMAITREKERIENDWAVRCERRRVLPAEIAAIEKKVLSEADEKKHLEAIEHEGETLRALEELRRTNIQIEEYEHQIKAARKKEGKCPCCGQNYDTDELVTRLEGSIASLRSRVPTLDSAANRYDAQAARQALGTHREAVIRVDALKKEFAGLADFKPDVLPNTKGHQEKIDELEARISKGQGVLSGIATHEARRDAFLRSVAARESLAAKRESADTLAKWCGPSGVQAQMSSGKLGPFADAINAVLKGFGYQMNLSLDPYAIQVAREGSPFLIDLDSLSESEKWRFSMAFQCALAKATGLNLVCLDRCDVLVGPNRGTMLKTILACELDQVFLFASVDGKAKLPDAFTVFDLELDEKGATRIAEKSPSS